MKLAICLCRFIIDLRRFRNAGLEGCARCTACLGKPNGQQSISLCRVTLNMQWDKSKREPEAYHKCFDISENQLHAQFALKVVERVILY